jgi:hypothetical protein
MGKDANLGSCAPHVGNRKSTMATQIMDSRRITAAPDENECLDQPFGMLLSTACNAGYDLCM